MTEDYQNNNGRKPSSVTIVSTIGMEQKQSITQTNACSRSTTESLYQHWLQKMLQKISKFHKEDHSHPQGCAGERWLSPDMNDEEKQFEYQTVGDRKKTCYITIDKKTKRLCKTWLAAGFMILVGSLIVIAFVLTGLRRLAISSRQHHASITTTNNSINLIIPASTTTTLLLYPSTYVASTEFITHTPYTTVI